MILTHRLERVYSSLKSMTLLTFSHKGISQGIERLGEKFVYSHCKYFAVDFFTSPGAYLVFKSMNTTE
jgi:hypothetical protein